jgi:hypothetical protein
MIATPSAFLRSAGLICAGAVLALPTTRAASDETPVPADAFPSYESYIKISGSAAWVNGDDAAFAKTTGMPSAGAAGIEDFYYSKDVNDSTTVTAKGHAMAGTEDYLADLNVTTANVGSIDAGYKRFRTFYDGVGGFFPLANQFEVMGPEDLHVDRSAFWVDAKLALPNRPVFEISYHDEKRTGMKDSTEWGPLVNPDAVVAKGALVGNAAPANAVYITPNVQSLDEHHQILEGSMTATIGKVTETLKLTEDWVNNDDARSYMKYPNSNVIADPTVTVQDDEETRDSHTFRFLNETDTKFNDLVALDIGLTYSHLSSTNGGNWITPTYSATANAVYNALTAADIYGTSKDDDYVGNAFLKFTPNPNWLADIGFRDESDTVGSSGGFTNTTLATGAKTVASANIVTRGELTYSHYADHIASPEASVQYTGISNLVLYGSFDDRITRGTQHWINPYVAVSTTGAGVVTMTPAPIGSVFFQDANQDYEDVKVGANWNATTKLTVRAEIYRKDHENKFIGSDDIIGTASYGGLYVTGYTFTGMKFSVIYKPLPEISFDTRYQPQSGNMSVLANVANGGLGNEITSGQAKGQLFSETINWTPNSGVYLQGNINVVYNYIQTSYPFVLVSASTYIPPPVQNSNDNYVSSSILIGFVLDKQTDAQLQMYWQQAKDYNPQVALGGEPYGAGFEIAMVTAGLKHKFSDRLIGEGKVGFIRKTDDLTGGFTNYQSPLAYLAFTYSL